MGPYHYYEVLRPADKNDLDEAGRDIAAVLESLPAAGYVRAGMLSGGEKDEQGAERAIAWACLHGIMQKANLGGRIMELESVRFWLGQLGRSRMKNVGGGGGGGTRRSYADKLEAFNGWLPGNEFPAGDGSGSKTFSDVEDLLRFCEKNGAQVARRVLRQYMAESSGSGCPLNTAILRCSAVKSYFAAHDVRIDVKVDRKRHDDCDVRDDSEMGLLDFYKVMISGGMDAMARAVMMVKFQAGLDSSTLADRFNFEAYPQMVKHFGAEDCGAWDLDRCPVPVRLVRVKTGFRYTTFVDRDAVACLQDCLRWKEGKYGKKGHDKGEPLFVTNRETPISPNWISKKFSKAATNAGVQRKVTSRMYNARAHEVRDLLKSTLRASGCAAYAADHVLGHAPRDSYEKQAALYPETLRAEYAKASWRLNLFSGFEKYLDLVASATTTAAAAATAATTALQAKAGAASPGQAPPQDDRYEALEAQQQELKAEIRNMAAGIADMFRIILAGKKGEGVVGLPDGEAARRIKDLWGVDGSPDVPQDGSPDVPQDGSPDVPQDGSPDVPQDE